MKKVAYVIGLVFLIIGIMIKAGVISEEPLSWAVSIISANVWFAAYFIVIIKDIKK